MNSLPTIDQANLEKFWGVIKKLDPELYLIKIALKETGVNPIIIPRIIRAISNLAIGTRFGKVQIFMQKGIITQIKPEESDQINKPAVVDKEI